MLALGLRFTGDEGGDDEGKSVVFVFFSWSEGEE